jgi:hypothetical protein
MKYYGVITHCGYSGRVTAEPILMYDGGAVPEDREICGERQTCLRWFDTLTDAEMFRTEVVTQDIAALPKRGRHRWFRWSMHGSGM